MDLMGMLPGNQYAGEKHVVDFQGAVQKALEHVGKDYDDLLLQLRVSTATWGLRHWEDAYGLATDYKKPDGLRRDRVIAKIRGQKTTTLDRLKSVVESFLTPDMPVEIRELFEQYLLDITISNIPLARDYRADILAAVKEVIPAHLGFCFTVETAQTTCPLYIGGGVTMAYMQTILPERQLTYDFWTDGQIKAAAANITYTVLPPLAT